jgi:hypothetical protein
MTANFTTAHGATAPIGSTPAAATLMTTTKISAVTCIVTRKQDG